MSQELLAQRLIDLQNERDSLLNDRSVQDAQYSDEIRRLTEQVEFWKARTTVLTSTCDEVKGKLAEFKQKYIPKSAAADQMSCAEKKWHERELDLTTQIKELHLDQRRIGQLRTENEQLQREVTSLKEKHKRDEEMFNQDLYDMKKTLMSENDRLRNELQKHRDNDVSALARTTTSFVPHTVEEHEHECRRLMKELNFHERTTDVLQEQNDELRNKMKHMKLEYELMQNKEEEFARRGMRQSRMISELKSKISTLERTLNHKQYDLEAKQNEWSVERENAVTRVERENRQLQHSLTQAQRDLKKMRALSKTILAQRTEIETFFLEALEEVKDEIRQRDKQEYEKAKHQYRHVMRLAAASTVLGCTSHNKKAKPAQPPPPPEWNPKDRVHLADLSLTDRQRVLEYLFAKLNGSENAYENVQSPPHTFPSSSSPAPTSSNVLLLESGESTPPSVAGSTTFLTE